MSATAASIGAAMATASTTAHPVKFEVRHLDFYYGQTHALKDVNLTLGDRSITACIGPSGCGKSTLLRVFNRMYALYSGHRVTGDVLLDGEDILAPTVDVNADSETAAACAPSNNRSKVLRACSSPASAVDRISSWISRFLLRLSNR